MRGFSFYGDTTDRFPFSGKEMQQYQEQIKRIRSNHRLTVLSFVLLVLAIVETMFFVTVQLMLKSSEYVGLLGVILELLTLIIVAATVHGYRKMSIDLRSVDLAVLIIAELLFGFSEFMMYVYKQPFYMYVIAGISFVLILYILLFVKAKIKERVTFAALPLVMLVAAGFLSINTSIFTVRYVYLSSDGYYNDVSNNDMAHFYYTESVNVTNFSKLPSYGTKGIYSMSEYENFCNSYKGSVNMSELLNFSRNYSDGFFNSNCLYVAPVELESSADRVSFRGLSYAISSQIPCVQYQKSKDSNQSKGVCLMLIEVPLKDDEKINNIVELKTDSVIMAR
ncbi:hypothetical protein [Ruminococcus sp.]